MGLVNELQESAQTDDVITMLRKAKRVSSKLGRRDISDWLDHEQNGYPDQVKVPFYRQVGVSFCYNTNGYVPAGYGQIMNGIVPLPGISIRDLTLPISEPIGTITAWFDAIKSGNGLYQPLDGKLDATVRSMLANNNPSLLNRVTLMVQLDNSQIQNIPEQVKNRVLDWACDLESAGVTGDHQSFSENEKQAAQMIIFNISNSTIEQLNNSGDNLKES